MSLAIKNGLPRTALRFLTPAAIMAVTMLSSGAASAASLQGPISGWQQGNEPGNISMHIYVPDNLAANPPLLVLLHYCGSNASGIFGQANDGGIVSNADQNGYILVVPSTTLGCWDVATPQSMTHDGGGHTGAIVHMVQYAVSEYGGNADRVYAVGTSGGAMAMQGLLAVYPDVFKGGSGFSGVPAGCWGVGNADGSWSNDCANGNVTHTAQEWGDLVRDMYPGYDGFRPRVQIYHGSGDTTISFTNHTEAVKEWTNVMGLSETPTETSSVNVGGTNFNREVWKDDCDNTVLDVLTEPGGPHNTSANMNGQEVLPFLALNVLGDEDPQAASECGGMASGSGGGSGAGGSDAGVGGSDAGAGGNDAGAGGSAVGAGGSAVGAGGAGTMPAGGGSAVGAGGAGTTTGGTAGVATGGTAAVAAGGTGAPGAGGAGEPPVTDDSDTESSGGCSWAASNTSRPVHGLALAGLFVAMFARRRSKRAARVS